MVGQDDKILLSFAAAAAELSERIGAEHPVAARTIRRWATTGIRGVILATTYIGGRRFVSRQALDDFFQAIHDQRPATPTARPARGSDRDRLIRSQQAVERIRAMHHVKVGTGTKSHATSQQ